MELTKKILNISIAISIITCSFALFIYSIKGNTVNAQTTSYNGFDVIGVLNGGVGKYDIIGFNPKTGQTKILGYGKY